MARFVVSLRWTPADYWRLTVAEREAIAHEIDEQNKRQ